jgi:membrane associated rhomboid family serine protease
MSTSPPERVGSEEVAGAVPVCPRHPDRESYVRCQRCGRPACPECQRPAPVGVQCVDCVREQARSGRIARTAFGGLAGTSPRVTQSIIGVCVATYLLQLLAGDQVTGRLAFVPYAALAEPWRFLTSAFLHAPGMPLHILFNMYALWLTGPYLEQQLGRARFAALYLLSALGGSVFFLLLADPSDAQQWLGGALGASGAVFGLFAALLVVNRRLGRDSGPIMVVIGINAVIGFVIPNVAWQAHLGGLLTGLAVAAVLAYAPRRQRAGVQAGGLVAIAMLLLGLVAYKVTTVPTGAFF